LNRLKILSRGGFNDLGRRISDDFPMRRGDDGTVESSFEVGLIKARNN
jgi:hypothetical protein